MAVDGARIIQAVMRRSRIRDAKGIIPIFGVYLSLNQVEYYNRLSFEFEGSWDSHNSHEARALLIEAAQECGYATFQGIRTSVEWQQLVEPMVETEEDQIHAFSAITVALGWGDLSVAEFIPEEKLVIRARSGYEAEGFLQHYAHADTGKCFMLCGVTAAFMDLMYGPDYPDGCFTYKAMETRCRAMGDDYCEFVAQQRRVEP